MRLPGGSPMTMSCSGTRSSLLRRRARQVALLVCGLVVLALAVPGAAQATGSGGDVPPGKAWVRAGHFVPGMGSARITLQPLSASTAPITVAGQTSYGSVSDYRKLAPGSYTVSVAMSDAPSGSAPMLSRSLTVRAGQARTLAILGTATAPRLAVLSDDLTSPPSGTARVRLLSASDEADTVTVSAVGGPTIAQDAVQGQATDYTDVPAGTWTLQLQSGTATGTLQDVPIVSGSVYTVVVLDGGADTVKLQVVTDAAGAVTAPKGGAETGLGGMAPGRHVAATHRHDTLLWRIGTTSLVLMVAIAGFGLARRRMLRVAP